MGILKRIKAAIKYRRSSANNPGDRARHKAALKERKRVAKIGADTRKRHLKKFR